MRDWIIDGAPPIYCCNSLIGHALAEINLAVEDAAHCHEHLLRGFLLHDVAVGARAQGTFRVDGLVVHGEHEHGKVRICSASMFEQFEAIGASERDVEDHDVGMQVSDCLHRSLRLFCLAANLHVLLLIDEERESLAHEWVIVDNKNGLLCSLHGTVKNGIRRHSHFLFRGH